MMTSADMEAVIRDLADSIRENHEEFMAKLAAKDGRIQYLEGEVARLEKELDLSDARNASQR